MAVSRCSFRPHTRTRASHEPAVHASLASTLRPERRLSCAQRKDDDTSDAVRSNFNDRLRWRVGVQLNSFPKNASRMEQYYAPRRCRVSCHRAGLCRLTPTPRSVCHSPRAAGFFLECVSSTDSSAPFFPPSLFACVRAWRADKTPAPSGLPPTTRSSPTTPRNHPLRAKFCEQIPQQNHPEWSRSQSHAKKKTGGNDISGVLCTAKKRSW